MGYRVILRSERKYCELNAQNEQSGDERWRAPVARTGMCLRSRAAKDRIEFTVVRMRFSDIEFIRRSGDDGQGCCSFVVVEAVT